MTRLASIPGVNSGPASTSDNDWASQVVDTLESIVGAVKSKTSDPANKFARTVVLALMAAGLGLAALLMLTIGGVRLLVNYLPMHNDAWLAYLLLGMFLLLLGLFVWHKGRPAVTR